MDALIPTYEVCAVQPGAKERIQKRIKETKEARKKRNCKSCFYYKNDARFGMCGHDCNFAHDSYKPAKKFV